MGQTINGISSQEGEAWLDVVEQLKQKGVSPGDVQKLILQHHPHANPTEGLIGAARATLNSSIKWKHLFYGVVAVVGVAVVLKLVGMAFDLNIPLIHSAGELTD